MSDPAVEPFFLVCFGGPLDGERRFDYTRIQPRLDALTVTRERGEFVFRDAWDLPTAIGWYAKVGRRFVWRQLAHSLHSPR